MDQTVLETLARIGRMGVDELRDQWRALYGTEPPASYAKAQLVPGRKPGPAKPSVRRDGDAVVIDIPMNLRRRSGRKEIVLPPDETPIAARTASAKPATPLALALARAFRWQEMIETGAAKSNSDLARSLKLDQSYIARTIRLASLAPDIVEAVLDGQEPDGLSLWGLRRDVPMSWDEQRQLLASR